MEGIEHTRVEVNGINMHVAVKGQGPVVLFLHGFPELWYSWRHQILALSHKGYRCVAPDLRGFGDTDAPASVDSYNCVHVVSDLVALIQSLQVEKVFLVGHDWGAIIGWYLCLFRPELVKAYEEGKVEAEMAQVGAEYAIKNMLTNRRTGPPIFPKGEYGTAFNPDMKEDLPSWLTQQDLAYFVSKFEKTGFTGGLNYYRNFNKNWELTAPWSGAKIKVPVKFIAGELDSVYTSLGMEDYIESGGFKEDVPGLEEVIIQPGVAHFNNQETPHDITNHIYNFITKF
ncbi:hypothetical protein AHAS_Ahas06G0044300 [Arachis hypogaea]